MTSRGSMRTTNGGSRGWRPSTRARNGTTTTGPARTTPMPTTSARSWAGRWSWPSRRGSSTSVRGSRSSTASSTDGARNECLPSAARSAAARCSAISSLASASSTPVPTASAPWDSMIRTFGRSRVSRAAATASANASLPEGKCGTKATWPRKTRASSNLETSGAIPRTANAVSATGCAWRSASTSWRAT